MFAGVHSIVSGFRFLPAAAPMSQVLRSIFRGVRLRDKMLGCSLREDVDNPTGRYGSGE